LFSASAHTINATGGLKKIEAGTISGFHGRKKLWRKDRIKRNPGIPDILISNRISSTL
jgi:hypothetical protein